jgi:hypothetical protein
MSVRRANDSRPDAPPPIDASEATAGPKAQAPRTRKTAPPAAATMPVGPPRSRGDAEARYAEARDAWIASMRKANSGRSADLASLAISQQAYERAMAEVEVWRSGARVAFKIEPENHTHELETAIGQEFAWRRVHELNEKPLGALGRLVRRLTRRG